MNTSRNYDMKCLPSLTTLAACMSVAYNAYAVGLEQRAVYDMTVLVGGDPAEVGQCSAFVFGDVGSVCGSATGPFVDNEESSIPIFDLPGGNGIGGDGIAGTIQIETSKADSSGNNTFTISSFQVDPYLNTPGGTFKTTTGTIGLGANTGGTLDPVGNMTLDVTGRTGLAGGFISSIGEQPWNIDDSNRLINRGVPVTKLWEPFTTGSSSNFVPSTGAPNITLIGRPIGDANGDNILDAILVSAGNVGASWQSFDGTPYSEAFNVQFSLVSAKPVANPDTVNTAQDNSLLIDVATDLLFNDTIATNVALTFSSFSQPTQAGSAIVDNSNGSLTYTPAAGFFGVDTFTYTIQDAAMETDTTTVTVNVSAAGNNPPVANDFPVVTNEDTAKSFDPTTNDTDPDGDPITISAFDPFSVEGGIVVSNGGNSLTYTPPSTFNGTDSFGYTISDGKGGTGSASVLITVSSVNNSPVCSDVNQSTGTDTALKLSISIDLLSTCTDPEGDPVTLGSFTQPMETGSMVTSDGVDTLTYTPNAGFKGKDSFTYTATDGTTSDTRTVFVDVGKIFGNFTMLDADGGTFGGTNDVAATWDGTFNTAVTDTNFNMTMKSDSDFPFFGFQWFAHDIRVFGPGTYTFDTSCSVAQLQSGVADCGGTPNELLTLTVDANQLGAHMLFDWNITSNIDVALQWDQDGVYTSTNPLGALYVGPAGPTPDTDCVYQLVSRDGDGDDVPGYAMIDGPFIGFRANFNINLDRNCGSSGDDTSTAPKSSIKSADPGGCTLATVTTTPLERSDYWIVFGFITWLGSLVVRKKILDGDNRH